MESAIVSRADILNPPAPAPAEITLVRIEADAGQVDRIREKVEAAKRSLGEKYLCHPANRVVRKAA